MCNTCLFRRPIVLFDDNEGAETLASNPQFHAQTKHLVVRYHFQRQEVEAVTSSGFEIN